MDLFCDKLANWLIKKSGSKDELYNIYKYGIQFAFEQLIFIIICLIISVMLNVLGEILIFLLVFSLIRSYSGGAHCKTYRYCFITSVLSALSVVFVAKFATLPIYLANIFAIICCLFLYINVSFSKKSFTQEESNYYKKKLFRNISIVASVLIIFNIMGWQEFISLVMYTLMLIIFSLLITHLRIKFITKK